LTPYNSTFDGHKLTNKVQWTHITSKLASVEYCNVSACDIQIGPPPSAIFALILIKFVLATYKVDFK